MAPSPPDPLAAGREPRNKNCKGRVHLIANFSLFESASKEAMPDAGDGRGCDDLSPAGSVSLCG